MSMVPGSQASSAKHAMLDPDGVLTWILPYSAIGSHCLVFIDR